MAAPETPDDGRIIQFSSYEEAQEFITDYEKKTTSSFSKWHMKNHGINRLSTLDGHRVWWEDRRGEVVVKFAGVPFVNIGSEVRQCHQGQNKKRLREESSSTDHKYQSGKKRIQHTKKFDCPVYIRMKMVILFPEYEITGEATEWCKRSVIRKLREEFKVDGTIQEFRIYVQIQGTHTGHLVGELSGYGLPLHPEVRHIIRTLVDEGVTNVGEISRHLERSEVCANMPSSNRRFRPTLDDVRNHVDSALRRKRYSDDDQKNLLAEVTHWKEDLPEDHIFFRPAAEDDEMDRINSLLFVYQSSFQRDLMARYGGEMVVMDSTYNTTKHDIPLFLLCVCTNVGYSTVAFFLLSKETKNDISEALEVIKMWNPGWKPKSFMCDFDYSEISALEQTFEGADVFTCDFHREQSWLRWLNKNDNKAVEHREIVLKQLRTIANSLTEEKYEEAVTNLKRTDLYKQSAAFRHYIEKQWLLEKKRWVYCYRQNYVNIRVSTTNGVEAMNKKLKYSYLKNVSGSRNLSGLAKILIEKFLPDCQNLYIRNNIVCLSSFRKYSTEIPLFLVDKPRNFVNHCLQRLSPTEVIEKEDIIQMENCFKVMSPSGVHYFVNTCTEIPSCSCSDWNKFHWPCKHMLAVFTHFPMYGWDSLSAYYKCLPWFNIDSTILVKSSTDSVNVPSTDGETISPQSSITENSMVEQNIVEHSTELDQNETVPVNLEIDESVNLIKNGRYMCLALLKNIQSAIYCIDDVKTIEETKEKLQDTVELVSSKIPKLCGLPLRASVKRNRRRVRNAKKYNNKKLAVQPPENKKQIVTEVKLDEGKISEVQLVEEDNLNIDVGGKTLEPKVRKKYDTKITCSTAETINFFKYKVLDKLWNDNESTDLPVLQVGPYILSSNSFKYLKSTLSDEVIDAYMTLMLTDKPILYINCVTATSIFEGSPQFVNFMARDNVLSYDLCMAVVNEGGAHWVLLIIIPKERRIIYVNPMGENRRVQHQYLAHWYYFLQRRHQKDIENNLPGPWSVTTEHHAKQQDSTSCGVYVLKFAENYINGRQLSEHINVSEERKAIGRRLISSSDYSFNEHKVLQTIEPSETIPKHSSRPPQKKTIKNCTVSTRKSKRPPQRKRKRSSFFYPSVKRLERRHCVCQKKDDGRLYWECEHCLKWFHPSCIGVDEKDGADGFHCDTCKAFLDPELQSPEDGDDIDGKINFNTALKLYPSALEQLEGVIACSAIKCTKIGHQRHHSFVCDLQKQLKQYQKRCGFGLKFFTVNTIETITDKVRSDLLYKVPNKQNPVTSLPTAMVKHVNMNSDLWKLFFEHKLLASQYAIYVLVKEVLILISAQLFEKTYHKCEEECLSTEILTPNL